MKNFLDHTTEFRKDSFRRAMALLLAALMTFSSFPVSVFAEEAGEEWYPAEEVYMEPVTEEEPIAWEEPAVEEPVIWEEPTVEEPVIEEEPAPVETPAPTEEPAPVETPAPTEEPTPTETPAPTEEPAPAETPAPTEEPVPTETPAPTEAPVPQAARSALDLTDQLNVLSLGLEKWYRVTPDMNYVPLAAWWSEGETIDVSAEAHEADAFTLGVDLVFDLWSNDESACAVAGDTFTVQLPVEIQNVNIVRELSVLSFTEDNHWNRLLAEAVVHTGKEEGTLAITFGFNETIPATYIRGAIRLQFVLHSDWNPDRATELRLQLLPKENPADEDEEPRYRSVWLLYPVLPDEWLEELPAEEEAQPAEEEQPVEQPSEDAPLTEEQPEEPTETDSENTAAVTPEEAPSAEDEDETENTEASEAEPNRAAGYVTLTISGFTAEEGVDAPAFTAEDIRLDVSYEDGTEEAIDLQTQTSGLHNYLQLGEHGSFVLSNVRNYQEFTSNLVAKYVISVVTEDELAEILPLEIPGGEEAGEYCLVVAAKSVQPEEPALIEQTVEDKLGLVTVSGLLPEGVTVSARALTEEELAALAPEGYAALFAYDITLWVNGEEYQPEQPVEVTVRPQEPIEALAEESEAELAVFHFAEAKTSEEEEAAESALIPEPVNCAFGGEGEVVFTAESFSIYGIMLLEEPAGEPAPQGDDPTTITISGSITYDEKDAAGTDWVKLLRPASFQQNSSRQEIKVQVVLMKSIEEDDGTTSTITYTKTLMVSDNPGVESCYLELIPDGAGGGDFTITKIPTDFIGTSDDAGNEIPAGADLSGYNVFIENGSMMPYYQSSTEFVAYDSIMSAYTLENPVKESVKTGTVFLKETIQPADAEDASFAFTGTYSNPYKSELGTEAEKIEQKYTINGKAGDDVEHQSILLPLGIGFEYAQTPVEGYSEPKTKVIIGDIMVPDTTSGTLTDSGSAATVHFTNVAQNKTVEFSANWFDNNNPSRPTAEKVAYDLWCTVTVDGEEKEYNLSALSAEERAALGVPATTVCTIHANQSGTYAFTDLPFQTPGGQNIAYSVKQTITDPDNNYNVYPSTDENGNPVFDNVKNTEFKVKIEWLDKAFQGSDTHRPSLEDYKEKLNLYRFSDGAYQPVDANDYELIKDADGSWVVRSKSKVDQFDRSNHEYAYVLVQGHIDGTEVITEPISVQVDGKTYQYNTHYNNGTGTHGNDTEKVYNGGSIINILTDTTTFSAYKSWKDDKQNGDESRPASTVTLWRYVKGTDADKILENAAPVVYPVSGGETIISVPVAKAAGPILFNSTTLDGKGLPSSAFNTSGELLLPLYDDQGAEYIYFLREEETEAYGVHYYGDSAGETPELNFGATNGGLVKNVQREKVAVHVTKEWVCPSNLADLDGISVDVALSYDNQPVSQLNNEKGSFAPLPENTSTISGFTSNIIAQDTTFYVNAYNDNGEYIMDTATIAETGVKEGDTPASIENGVITLANRDQFTYASVLSQTQTISPEGFKQYEYTVTNTITGSVVYTLNKKWSVPAGVRSQVDHIEYEIYAYTEDPAVSGVVAHYKKNAVESIPVSGDENELSLVLDGQGDLSELYDVISESVVSLPLPKYDANGYAILYKASEVSVIDKSENNILDKTITYIENGETKTGSIHSYAVCSEDNTTVTNYMGGEGNDYEITFAKAWKDNGDTISREPVIIYIYEKSAILHAEKLSDVQEYKRVVLSANNLWASLPVRVDKHPSNYIITEYKLGAGEDHNHVAEYSLEELRKLANNEYPENQDKFDYSINGHVQTENHQYAISLQYHQTSSHENENKAYAKVNITNTRDGQLDLAIQKNWVDGSNAENDRPQEITFELAQYKYVNAAEESGYQYNKTYTLIAKRIETETGNTWTYRLADDTSSEVQQLPMYDENGRLYEYVLTEKDECILADGTSGTLTGLNYVSVQNSLRETPAVSGAVDHVLRAYTYTNTKTSTAPFVIYKKWNDIGVNNQNRPDLYFTLWRKIPNGEPEKLELGTDYADEIRTANPTDKPGCDWKIEIRDLPSYDSAGNPYTYYMTEKMNNNGVTPAGIYVPEFETETNEERAYNNQVITNTITGGITSQGTKIWENLPAGTTADDLPTPTLTLYRVGADLKDEILNQWTDEQISAAVYDGRLTKVESCPMEDSRYKYSFPTTGCPEAFLELSGGITGRLLKKFAPDGRRYYYLVRESLLENQEYIYTKTTRSGNLVNTFNTAANSRSIELTKNWVRDHVVVRENKYPTITFDLYRYVWKNEHGVVADGLSATGEALIAYKKGTDAEGNHKNLIDSCTIDAADFATGIAADRTVNFENLLIFSPKGERYGYYIVERTTYAPAGSDGPVAGYETQYTGKNDSEIAPVSRTGIDITDTLSVKTAENENKDSVSIKNEYKYPGDLTMIGHKVWNDYQNISALYGKRPPDITITLRRSTDKENNPTTPEYSNAINWYNVPVKVVKYDETGAEVRNSEGKLLDKENEVIDEENDIYLTWDKTNSSKWEYQIHHLEQYAPNGLRYLYEITETLPSDPGYKQVVSRVTKWSTDTRTTADGKKVLDMADLKNELSGSYTVRKNWVDGHNLYGLRPSSVTIVLEQKTDNTNWHTILWPDELETQEIYTAGGLRSVKLANGTTVVGITLTNDPAFVVPRTDGDAWEHKFTNLPYADPSGNPYTYRAQEIAIGGFYFEGEDNNVNGYTRDYLLQNTSRTNIKNSLQATKLTVEKAWEDFDAVNNLYGQRPEKVAFQLQRKVVSATEVNPDNTKKVVEDWKMVLVNNQPTFFISDANNWRYTLENLPTVSAKINDDGTIESNLIYFRAVEVHKEDTYYNYPDEAEKPNEYKTIRTLSGQVKYANNYEDKTPYSEQDFNQTSNTNNENVKNELITNSEIQAKKTWQRTSGESVSATFELLYKKKNEQTWHCYGTNPKLDVVDPAAITDWSQHTAENHCLLQTISSTEAGEDASVIWKSLPTYDLEGNELEYKIIEHPVPGYTTVYGTRETSTRTEGDKEITTILEPFTNIEQQPYTVQKIWNRTPDGATDAYGKLTSTFQLQMSTVPGVWKNVDDVINPEKPDAGYDADLAKIIPAVSGGYTVTLTGDSTKDWSTLPKYTVDGKTITYRAVETKINGNTVENNTDGNYIVTYKYDDPATSAVEATGGAIGTTNFGNRQTTSTNRMVYGFVNLAKTAAHLSDPNGTTGTDGTPVKLDGVKFNIFKVVDGSENLYVQVVTDANGQIVNPDGKTYGASGRYLVPGTYKIVEANAKSNDYSLWSQGIEFTVGQTGGTTDTGEHGTAWIYTEPITNSDGSNGLALRVKYLHAAGTHTFEDQCEAVKDDSSPAYNIESRGVISFTKKGENGGALVSHALAENETPAYFGVYTDSECSEQVAGMMSTDGSGFYLVPNDIDRSTINASNAENIPYLRSYGEGYTLLSGTYYIKELIAPPGYELDSTVRTAKIEHINTTDVSDTSNLKDVYANNKAAISIGEASGTADYEWNNTPNVIHLYKMDQFGNIVEDSSLSLTITRKDNSKLLNGEKQLVLTPGSAAGDNPKYVDYGLIPATGKNGWTLTGVFEADKEYVLSESSTPANYLSATDFYFKVDTAGNIVPVETDNPSGSYEAKDSPAEALAVVLETEENITYYSQETVVLRDKARTAPLELTKINSVTDQPIEYISFKLYKMVEEVKTPVLEDVVYLTTDAQGKIDTSTLSAVKNQITGGKLSEGLTIGEYILEEVERGASDSYRLLDPITFHVEPTSDQTAPGAAATKLNPAEDSNTLKNTPVKTQKLLDLTKVDSENTSTKLTGARFTLTYTSITDNQDGSQTRGEPVTINCVTDAEGKLYEANNDWTVKKDSEDHKVPVDISNKGNYILKETLAPETYMTPTAAPLQVTFDVDSSNKIVHITTTNATLIVNPHAVTNTSGEDVQLKIDLWKNEKTIVSVAKLNDIVASTLTKHSSQTTLTGESLTGATLEIYEGTNFTDDTTPVATLDNNSSWTRIGTLKENTIYTLHEAVTPEGYLTADDIYFYLFGTTGNPAVSVLKVWGAAGTKPTSISEGNWSTAKNISSSTLTMVDEAVIAPVDVQKVLGKLDGTYAALKDTVFDVSVAGGEKLGTAKTNSEGFLVWETIETGSYALGLIFNSAGKRVTSADSGTVIGKTIILRKNNAGYTFTETSAPANAYNDGLQTFTVKITDANYLECRECRNADGTINTDKYIDIKSAGGNTPEHTVVSLSTRTNEATGDDLVNPEYKSTVTLHKYDRDIEAALANVEGAQFKLYHATVTENADGTKTWTKGGEVSDAYVPGAANPTTDGIFKTGTDGNLAIEIHNKGYYILEETTPAAGYKLSAPPIQLRFQLVDEATNEQKAQNIFGYPQTEDETNPLKKDDNGVPNDRIMGSVELTKKDKDSGAALDGVQFKLERTSLITSQQIDLPEALKTVVTGKTYEYSLNQTEKSWSRTVSDGEPGTLKITGLEWGTYTLTETASLPEYKFDDTVAATNKCTFTVNASNASQKQTLTDMTNTKNRLTITKQNFNGNTLIEETNTEGKLFNDAEFLLYKLGTDGKAETTAAQYFAKPEDTAKTDARIHSGSTTIYGLAIGTYILREKRIPSGYEKLPGDIEFTMNRDGSVKDVLSVTVADDGTITPYSGTVEYVTNPDGTTEVIVKDTPIEIYIRKEGETSTEKLTGAIFKLTDACETCASGKKFADNTDAATGIDITVNDETGVLIPSEFGKEKLIANHTYKLTETKAPDGYECTVEVTFTVAEDGSITSATNTGGHGTNTVEIENHSLTTTKDQLKITNEKIRVSLTKIDAKDDSKKLDGVVFKLEPANGSTFAAGTITPDADAKGTATEETDGTYTLITDSNGIVDIPAGLLKHGNSYILTETSLGNNIEYRLAETEISKNQVTINVQNNGTVTLSENSGLYERNSTDSTRVIAKNEPINLDLTKIDKLTKAAVPGATLKLSYCEDPTVDNPVWTPVSNGSITDGTWTTGTTAQPFTYLKSGYYKLEEIVVPNGYIGNDSLYFRIKQNGTAVETNETGTPVTSGTVLQIKNPAEGKLPSGTTGITMKLPNARNHITLKKTAPDGKVLSISKLVNEAKFKLYKVTSLNETAGSGVISADAVPYYTAATATATTTEALSAGTAEIYGLAQGRYILHETIAPAGYELTKDVLFMIDNTGKVTLLGNAEVDYTQNTFTYATSHGNASNEESGSGTTLANTLSVKDTPIKIFIHKVSNVTLNNLKGAKFTLTDTGSGNLLADREASCEIEVKDDNGIVMIPVEKLIANHTYQLEETVAPDGYEVQNASVLGENLRFTFSVDENGQIIESTETPKTPRCSNSNIVSASVEDSGGTETKDTLKLTNEKIKLDLTKKSLDGTKTLEGVTFEIKPKETTDHFAVGVSFTNGTGDSVTISETNKNNAITLKTGSGGVLAFPDGLLVYGCSYVLTEKDLGTNIEYRLSNEESVIASYQATITVEKNGTVTLTTDSSTLYAVANDTLNESHLTVKNEPINLDISKVVTGTGIDTGKTAEPVSGAQLQLSYCADPTVESPVWTPVSNGTITNGTWTTTSSAQSFTYLKSGYYKLEETSVPDGYIQNPILYFKINQDGTAKEVTEAGATGSTSTLQISSPAKGKLGTQTSILMDVPNTRNRITLTKQDYDNHTLSSDNLQNQATFVLYKATPAEGENPTSGTFEETAVNYHTAATGSDTANSISVGETTIYALTQGTYILHEQTAPAGYELTKDVLLKIGDDGVLNVLGNVDVTGNAYSNLVTAENAVNTPSGEGTALTNSLIVKDTPIKIFIHKVSKDEPPLNLAGAEFELRDASGQKFADRTDYVSKKADGTTSIVLVTGNDGKVEIPIEKLIANHTYTLTETKAPDGYECQDDSGNNIRITFSVDENGKIKNTEEEKPTSSCMAKATVEVAQSVDEADTLQITNTKIGLTISKIDADSTTDPKRQIPNVVFEIKPFGDADYFAQGITYVNADGTSTTTNGTHGRNGETVTLKTNSDGIVAIPEGLLVHDKEYLLTETVLGTGNETYRFEEEAKHRSAKVTVNPDGTIEILTRGSDDYDNEYYQYFNVEGTADHPKIVMNNDPIELWISKIDQDTGLPLPGAKLKLFYQSGDTWTPVRQGVPNILTTVEIGLDADDSWITTDKPDQPQKISYLIPGIYKLVEVEAPEGYIKNPEQIFEIDQTGGVTITWVTDNNNNVTNPTPGYLNRPTGTADETEPNTTNLTVPNTKNKLQIIKTDLLWNTLSQRAPDATEIVDHVLLNQAEFQILSGGNPMWFVERQVPGTDEKEYVVVATGTENAVSTVYAGTSPVIRGLPAGNYVLHETVAPAGYELRSSDIGFSVDEYGIVTVDSSVDAAEYQLTPNTGSSSANEFKLNQLQVSNTPIIISIKKLGAEGETTGLPNAKFKLEDVCTTCPTGHNFADGSASGSVEVTTEDDGTVQIPIEKLIAGHTYKLTETLAPDGYKCNVTVTFTVKTDGKLSNLSSTGGYRGTTESPVECATLNTTEDEITIKDEILPLVITKVDGKTKAPLKDVKFKLFRNTGSAGSTTWSLVAENGAIATEDVVLVTDSDGQITITKILKGDYKLEEIETNDGYIKADVLYFNVGDNGAIKQINEDGTEKTDPNFVVTSPNADGNTTGDVKITAKNWPMSLKVIKQGPSGEALEDVAFKLECTSTGYSDNQTTTKPDGSAVAYARFETPPLTDGTYTLTEVKTASGYNLLSSPIIIEISRNNEGQTKVTFGDASELLLGAEKFKIETHDSETGEKTLALVVTNKPGFALPATGATTPQLPLSVLLFAVLGEAGMLFAYHRSSKRRRKGGEAA